MDSLGMRILDWIMEHIFPWAMLGLFAFIAIVLVCLAISALGPAPKEFTLRVSEWQCTQSHKKTTTTMILVGKIMVPSVHSWTVCDQFNRVNSD